MNSALILAGVSTFLFILKILMIWSKTNFPGNPVWQGISFLNSCLLYPWFLWGGYRLALFEQEKETETYFELTQKHDLEIQKERSQRYELERKLKNRNHEQEQLKAQHEKEILSIKAEFEKSSQTATEANDLALRSLL